MVFSIMCSTLAAATDSPDGKHSIFTGLIDADSVPGMDVNVVAVTQEHIQDLLESVAGLFAEDAGTHDPVMDTGWPARAGHAYYTELIGDEKALCLLAYTEHGAAGHLIGKVSGPSDVRPGETIGVLESLRVAEHSRRTGAGSALVAEFGKWARSKNVAEVRVTAFAANHGAVDFYRRNGFEPFELTLRRRPV
jgi:GNAT superfamily N-acetyltransferase